MKARNMLLQEYFLLSAYFKHKLKSKEYETFTLFLLAVSMTTAFAANETYVPMIRVGKIIFPHLMSGLTTSQTHKIPPHSRV